MLHKLFNVPLFLNEFVIDMQLCKRHLSEVLMYL